MSVHLWVYVHGIFLCTCIRICVTVHVYTRMWCTACIYTLTAAYIYAYTYPTLLYIIYTLTLYPYSFIYTYIYAYTYTVGQYYWLIFLILLLLFIPITFLTEPDATHIPQRTFSEHRSELWETLTNRTTLSLLIYVTGSSIITNLSNITTSYIQYYVIGLTNLQAGMVHTLCAII